MQEQAKSDEVIRFSSFTKGDAVTIIVSLAKSEGQIIYSKAEDMSNFFG